VSSRNSAALGSCTLSAAMDASMPTCRLAPLRAVLTRSFGAILFVLLSSPSYYSPVLYWPSLYTRVPIIRKRGSSSGAQRGSFSYFWCGGTVPTASFFRTMKKYNYFFHSALSAIPLSSLARLVTGSRVALCSCPLLQRPSLLFSFFSLEKSGSKPVFLNTVRRRGHASARLVFLYHFLIIGTRV
jgi:hypothetical protein